MNKRKIILPTLALLVSGATLPSFANVASTIESINALSDRAGYQINDVILTSELQRRVQTEAALQQAYYALLSEMSDIEADNTLEATGMRLTMTGYTPPSSGGFVPVSSIAPKVDGHGMPLGYCAWDHGATTGSADHIAGNTLVDNADPSFVVISSGTNRSFDTTCSDAAFGNLGGDDSAMAVSVGQGNYGVATNAYYGKPVASRAVLESLDTTNTEPGEMRMVLDSGMAYAWLDLNGDGTHQWEAVSSYFYSGDTNGLAAGGEYTTSPYAVGIGALFQDRTIAPMSALEVDGQVRIIDGDTWVNDAVGAQLHIGSQQAAAGTAGEVARMAIQPFSQAGGPYAFVARDTATDAFLDVRYGNATAAESILTLRNTGQVGIDSATPNAKLAIGGGDDPTQGPMLNLHGSAVNQFESGRIRLTESGDRFQGAYIHYDASSDVTGGTGGTLHIGMHNLNTNSVADDKNIISIGRSSGLVGINNGTPKHQLDVDGDIRASGGIFFGDLTIEARSTGYNRDGAAYLKHDGEEYYASHGRGLNLTIYEPDGTVVSSVRYDTHGVASDSDSLALAIDNMLLEQIGVITSRDAYTGNLTGTLRQTAKENGLIKMANSPGTPYRVPYAAIFQKGDGNKAYEQTSTDASDGQRAFLYAAIKNDTFFVMSSGEGVSGLQNSRSEYQAYIAQDNSLETLAGINAKGVTSISDSANNGPSVHYPGSFNDNGTSTNGYTLKTKIKGPSTKNGMHSINVRGYAYGNSEIIDFTVSFYSYMPTGSLRNLAFMNNGSYDPGVVEVAVDSNDNAVIRWENSLYWPRFYVTYFASGQNEGRDEALGWTMDTTIPSLSTYAKYRVVTNEAPSMLTLGTSMKSQDDMNNSPISIRERNRIGATSSDDRYAPNINFNWKGQDSKSLWMDSAGDLHYGGYASNGIPSTDGGILADKLTGLSEVTAERLVFGGGRNGYGDPDGYNIGMYQNDGAFLIPVHDNNMKSDLRMYITDDADDAFSIWGYTCGGGSCGDVNAASNVATFMGGGKVGIGTTDPKSALHVMSRGEGTVGDAELIIQTDINDAVEDDNPLIRLKQDGDLVEGIIGLNNNTPDDKYLGSVANALYLERADASSGASSIQFITGRNITDPTSKGSARMTITGDGRVGIGTNNPTRDFMVNGKAIFRDDTSFHPVILDTRVGSSTSAGGYTIFADGDSNQRVEYSILRGGNFRIWGSSLNSNIIWSSGANVHVAGSLYQNSDRRLKMDISDIDGALSGLSKIDGKTYRWKTDGPGSPLTYGLLAQELELVFPDLVATGDNGMKSVNYNGLIPVIIEAVKELDKKDQQQDEAIERHESILEQLKADIRRHETRLQGLEGDVGIESSTTKRKKADEVSDEKKVVEETVVARPPSAMTRFYGQ